MEKQSEDFLAHQFADAEDYRAGKLKCRKCEGKEFSWEASNLWCDNCGLMQRV